MQDFLSGETVNLTIRYGGGDQPVIPDVGTVTYTVLDHSGTAIAGLENVPVTTTTSTFQSTITVPSIYNTINASKLFERRTIFLRFQAKGQFFYQKELYRIVPSETFTASPADVRQFLGVNDLELPDNDLDMFAAYLFVRETFADPTDLDDALLSGDLMEIRANEAITMRAAIDIIPSLQNRVTQSETNGPMGFDRIKITDFSALLAEAYRRYNDALLLLAGTGVSTDMTLITTTQDVDPITAGT